MSIEKHSELPWYTSSMMGCHYIANDKNDIESGVKNSIVANLYGSQGQANAEFIVRCVNNHDKLVEALKTLIEESLSVIGQVSAVELNDATERAIEAMNQAEAEK